MQFQYFCQIHLSDKIKYCEIRYNISALSDIFHLNYGFLKINLSATLNIQCIYIYLYLIKQLSNDCFEINSPNHTEDQL